MVENNLRNLSAVTNDHRDRDLRLDRDGCSVVDGVRGEELVVQRGDLGISGLRELSGQAGAEDGANLSEIDDPRSQTARMQPEPHHVGGRPQQLRVDAGEERLDSAVRQDDDPSPVDHHRGVRLVRAVSTRLTCRAEMSAARASPSWLIR
jgi:hypothetical protein